MAMNIKGKGIVSKKETPKVTVEALRAKDEDGKFLADDESTPDINEAWESGYAPAKKKKRKYKSSKSK
jgi:hypothetical protein